MGEDGFYLATRVVNPVLAKYKRLIAEAYGLGVLRRPWEYLHLDDVALYVRLEELRDELALGRITGEEYAGEVVRLLERYSGASREAIQIVGELYEALTGRGLPPIQAPRRRVEPGEELRGVCSRCVLNGDSSVKPLRRCVYCGELYCVEHVEPRLVMTFNKYQAYLQQYRDIAPLLREHWSREDGHPCIAYTTVFWREYERRRAQPPLVARHVENVEKRREAGVSGEWYTVPVRPRAEASRLKAALIVLIVLTVVALTLIFYDDILALLYRSPLPGLPSGLLRPTWVSTLELENLAFNGTHITIKLRSPFHPILLKSERGGTLTIYPLLQPRSSEWLAPDYALVREGSAVLVLSVQRLTKALGQAPEGTYTIEAEGWSCLFKIEDGEILFKSSCGEAATNVYLPSRDILQAVLSGYTDAALAEVRRALWESGLPPSGLEAAWSILSWLEANTEYDALLLTSRDILTPLEFLNVRRGVCSDYAVFTAAAALASGFSKAYIVIMDTARDPHAAAGVVYNSRFYVLDQRRPPVEWDDYIQHVYTLRGEIQLMMIRAGLDLQVEAWILNPSELARRYPDSYSRDQTPPGVFIRAAEYLVEKYGKTPQLGSCPTCSALYYDLEGICQNNWLCSVYTEGYDEEFARMWADYFDKGVRLSGYHYYFRAAPLIYIQLIGHYLYFYFGG